MRALLLASLLLPGCYLSHERAMTDAAVPVADAGLVPDTSVSDAGTDARGDTGVDAGPPDAGVCDEPLLSIEESPIRCGHLLLGSRQRQVFALDLHNRSDRAMRVVRWAIAFDRGLPEDCGPRTVLRVGLYDPLTGAPYGIAMPTERTIDANFEAIIRPEAFTIPPGDSTVSVRVDLNSYVDGGCSGWYTEFGFASWIDIDAVWEDDRMPLPEECICSCLGGTPFFIGTGPTNTYRATLTTWADGTAWTRLATGEQEIGRFVASNPMNEGNYTATVTEMAFGFTGVFGGDERPRTLRVYRDAVVPENLLASTTFPTGMVGTAFWRDEIFTDMDVAAGTIRDIVVTLDVDGVFTSAALQVELLEARWTDGVSRVVRSICDGPTTAGTVTFAPAP